MQVLVCQQNRFDFFTIQRKKDCITNPQLIRLGGMEFPVLALSTGMWGGKAKGERNETAGGMSVME